MKPLSEDSLDYKIDLESSQLLGFTLGGINATSSSERDAFVAAVRSAACGGAHVVAGSCSASLTSSSRRRLSAGATSVVHVTIALTTPYAANATVNVSLGSSIKSQLSAYNVTALSEQLLSLSATATIVELGSMQSRCAARHSPPR